jgi:hypothetical protein
MLISGWKNPVLFFWESSDYSKGARLRGPACAAGRDCCGEALVRGFKGLNDSDLNFVSAQRITLIDIFKPEYLRTTGKGPL